MKNKKKEKYLINSLNSIIQEFHTIDTIKYNPKNPIWLGMLNTKIVNPALICKLNRINTPNKIINKKIKEINNLYNSKEIYRFFKTNYHCIKNINPKLLNIIAKQHNECAVQFVMHSNWKTEDVNLLQIRLNDKSNNTIAHLQVHKGWTTNNPEILHLQDENKDTVQSFINKYKKENP